nr:hypothetical protein [Paracoccus denitrificans]
MAHDLETVLAGDPFLQLLDLVATELDHLIRLDIDEMVVMFGTAGFVARPAVGEAVAHDQPTAFKCADRAIDRGDGDPRRDLAHPPRSSLASG